MATTKVECCATHLIFFTIILKVFWSFLWRSLNSFSAPSCITMVQSPKPSGESKYNALLLISMKLSGQRRTRGLRSHGLDLRIRAALDFRFSWILRCLNICRCRHCHSGDGHIACALERNNTCSLDGYNEFIQADVFKIDLIIVQ